MNPLPCCRNPTPADRRLRFGTSPNLKALPDDRRGKPQFQDSACAYCKQSSSQAEEEDGVMPADTGFLCPTATLPWRRDGR
jgi:hypothetical protein